MVRDVWAGAPQGDMGHGDVKTAEPKNRKVGPGESRKTEIGNRENTVYINHQVTTTFLIGDVISRS